MLGISKAKKATVNYYGIQLDGYMLPDGSYHLSKTDVGKAIDKYHKSVGEFLDGKSPEALPYKDYSFGEISVTGEYNGTTIHSVPLEIAVAYWTYWAQKGNAKAAALVASSTVENLTRLFDTAFGVTRTETERQQTNVENFANNEALFKILNMMENLTTKVEKMELASAEYDRLKENGKTHKGCLNILEKDNDEFAEIGITANQYLTSLGFEGWSKANTFSRRAAQAMRVGKNKTTLPMIKSNVVYYAEDIRYLEETLQSMLNLG